MSFQDWLFVEKEDIIQLLNQILAHSIKENWIDFPNAVDNCGLIVPFNSERAVKYSLTGLSEKLSEEFFQDRGRYVDVAAREYLNELSDEKLIHNLLSYEEEIELIKTALEILK